MSLIYSNASCIARNSFFVNLLQPCLHVDHKAVSVHLQQRELYRQDLIFRLQALRRRYPEYVTPQMVNTWGSDIASGVNLGIQVLRLPLSFPVRASC
eukprot:750391-Pelagomonas_calceolata.AAC.3